MAESNIAESLEVKFIDIFDDNLEDYPTAKQILDRGLSLPLVSVGGKRYFYGGISSDLIYESAKDILQGCKMP